MNNKLNAFIVFIVIYFIILLIVGVLAYLYQIKRQAFIDYNKKHFIKWNQYKKANFNDPLKEISFKYQLPSDEVALLEQNYQISVTTTDLVNKKPSKRQLKKELVDDLLVDDFIVLKENLKFKTRFNNYQFFDSTVYLTNKKIILEFEDKYLKLFLTDIRSITVCVINDHNNFLDGCFLRANNVEITIVGEVFKLVLIVQKLLQQKGISNVI
ncbi:hypothetical protein V2P24_01615 [Mycoplasma putrefaciens]|uniref:hypothetical protein n=1 Tax=Mycoplasma putrefaciens TaxID=2123 RepID=UPI003DA3F78E